MTQYWIKEVGCSNNSAIIFANYKYSCYICGVIIKRYMKQVAIIASAYIIISCIAYITGLKDTYNIDVDFIEYLLICIVVELDCIRKKKE